jgi:hypothetical protein
MKRILAAVLAWSLLTVACSDPIAPVTPTPVAPTIRETFSDTLLMLGANSHPFSVQQVGGLQVTITNIAPGATVGLGVGTPSGGRCLANSTVTTVAGPAAQLSGTATVTGPFCVTVYDTGSLVEAVTYTVTVIHS